ncbi:tryptophan 7-halogenase [Thalassotalea sp. LPB0316]|uniref:tryptophan halogenase family protein n=1 Tax=Thalassotalea sp. LPB0316 TaxID=2769490 RepID=UPI0018683402|nr:tryptophan halogenase family protein [Thalassotalea sp. LPB0316]QOL24564.1 tryptophan 7-halogenase [Thalassotalea sp. LPB0316]
MDCELNRTINRIIIVGGGTAGWLTAGLLAAEHINPQSNLTITLVESPDVKPIGVGEGTWPSMRESLQKLGISETDFLTQCDASFKQGSKFINWLKPSNHSYYHPFSMPHHFHELNLAEHWLPFQDEISFADALTHQASLCDNNKAPKTINTPEYKFAANYGYHLDAGKFSQFLQQHCCEKLGVNHILDHVEVINSDSDGNIASLNLKQHGELAGDLFIDCTGLKSLLLGEHYQVPLLNQQHQLFNDRALAVQIPYDQVDSPIASATLSTGQSAGWIWDIGLPTRRGIGYVYASNYQSEHDALETLDSYIRQSFSQTTLDDVNIKTIEITPGYRETFWHKNCVAIGLSAGFIEPLEASAIALVELSAKMIAEQLPRNQVMLKHVAKRFNEKFSQRWQHIIDFLKLHYVLSERDDSNYWRDNRDLSHLSDSLKEQLDLWQYQVPYTFDSKYTQELFPSASNQFILYGMGYKTQLNKTNIWYNNQARAQEIFRAQVQRTKQMSQAMPSNRALLEQLKTQRFSNV